MQGDKRLLRVVFDHAQQRVSKPRVGVVCRGWDFLEGTLTGMFVSPISGVLQSMPNSEEEEYQTTNTGRWQKIGIGDVTVSDDNGHPELLLPMSVNHTDDAHRYNGNNTAGVGEVTTTSYPENTGINIAQYAFGNATDQGAILIEFGWNSEASGAAGESCRVYVDGRLEIYRNGKPVCRGSFGSGGYQFGSARGGSYVKAADEYVTIRAEIRAPFLILTSSKGGVFQFSCPWAIDTYDADGTVAVPAAPVVQASNLWWYVPAGGASVIWSPVVYVTSGSAISAEFALSEIPGTGRSFGARPIPADTNVTVTLADPAGTGAFDVGTNRCRVKVVAAAAPVWVDGTSTRYEPETDSTDEDETDVTDWVRACNLSLEDGPEGLVASLEIGGDAPVDGLSEVENRPIRIELVAHPDDPDSPDTLVLLDGVGDAPEWIDGLEEDQTAVRIVVRDRLVLLTDAVVTEPVVFDGSKLCQPTGAGDSAVATVLRQGGFGDSEMDLPDIDFTIEHFPPQRSGDWSFSLSAGTKWWDALQALFDLAPSFVWGVRPTLSGPQFYVIDPETAASEARLYRTPETAEMDGDYEDQGLGAWPLMYAEHKRTKLPLEGNLVRVMGLDPSSQKPITTSRSNDASRNPGGAKDGLWLGTTRTIGFQSASLVTQSMVAKVADSLLAAVSQRQYVEPWRSFMLFRSDGTPLWRGDMITLTAALPDGEDSEVHISSMQPEIVDESGGGLMDDTGPLAPVSIRLANYTGGALVGLGGSGEHSLVARHRKRVETGGWRGQGTNLIPRTSPVAATTA
jgi:hypothetical protein